MSFLSCESRAPISEIDARLAIPDEDINPLNGRNRCKAIAPSSKRRFGAYPTDSCPDIRIVIAQTSSRRVDLAKWLSVKSTLGEDVVIAHMLRRSPGNGMTVPRPRAAAYAACVHLDPLVSYDVWCDERHIKSPTLGAGAMHIGNMRRTWRADIRSAFHVVNFCIP
jgi:hypothetical protein